VEGTQQRSEYISADARAVGWAFMARSVFIQSKRSWSGALEPFIVVESEAIQTCVSQVDNQLWNVNNGTVLLAWQAAEAAVVAAGFVSPGRIAVVSADAIIR
jgi:hypothetical protein